MEELLKKWDEYTDMLERREFDCDPYYGFEYFMAWVKTGILPMHIPPLGD